MKSVFYLTLVLFISISCSNSKTHHLEKEVAQVLDSWHEAAANADYNGYFGKMCQDAVFIGTDATENWDRRGFEAYAKPYFDQKKTWNFKVLKRNIYFDTTQDFAWFDELLETDMKICRGSGVVERQKGVWKIKHYVLSMTIPNEVSKEVIKVKDSIESKLIQEIRDKKPFR